MWGSNICHNCEKKHFLLWLFSREHICVKKTDKGVKQLSDILGRRDIKHVRQSNESTSKQIFVFPNICLCWWKTSSSDGRKHLIDCKGKTATKYRFSGCYFFFSLFHLICFLKAGCFFHVICFLRTGCFFSCHMFHQNWLIQMFGVWLILLWNNVLTFNKTC